MAIDTILTFSDYLQGNPGDPSAELEFMPGDYVNYLRHFFWKFRREDLPIIPPGPLPEALVEVNAGRWVWQCPACHTGLLVQYGQPVICYQCASDGWHDLRWPIIRDEIEIELLRQPGHRLFAPVRNWEPGWTLEDLRDRTARARILVAQGQKLVRALSIGMTRVWVDGETLSATNMNLFISDVIDDLAGRNGVIELEDSLRVLDGASGDRFMGLPGGTSAQRPAGAAGRMRWNQDNRAIDIHNGVGWGQVLDTNVLTFANLMARGLVGTGSSQLARGTHGHTFMVDLTVTTGPVQFTSANVPSGPPVYYTIQTRNFTVPSDGAGYWFAAVMIEEVGTISNAIQISINGSAVATGQPTFVNRPVVFAGRVGAGSQRLETGILQVSGGWSWNVHSGYVIFDAVSTV